MQLTTEHLKGEKDLTLKFVKFQDVQNIQLFVKDNQVMTTSLQFHYKYWPQPLEWRGRDGGRAAGALWLSSGHHQHEGAQEERWDWHLGISLYLPGTSFQDEDNDQQVLTYFKMQLSLPKYVRKVTVSNDVTGPKVLALTSHWCPQQKYTFKIDLDLTSIAWYYL